jgi:sigma-B regulation protein RsbU (phosphoserine phosphatase)
MSVTTMLLSQQTQLVVLAESWLASGAESFSVWSDGCLLAGWPANHVPRKPGLVAPIQVGQRIVGELHVAGVDATMQGRLSAEAELLAQIARLENDLDQMTSELIDAQDHLIALYDLTRAIRSRLGLGETLRALASVAMRLIKTEGAVALLSPMIVHDPAPLMDDSVLLSYFRQVQASSSALVLSAKQGAALPPEIQSLALVPIQVRGAISAGLVLLNKLDGAFSAPDLKLAQAIAEQAGAQIEHALLHQDRLDQARMQAEMDLARKVQLTLLPQQRPHTPGLEIFAESRPALQVGGDVYDFIGQAGRPFFLTQGDVAGKGISAALIMGMIHIVTSSAARFHPAPTPVGVLQRITDDLYDDFTNLGTFATMFVGQYDAAAGELHFANAGHAPVIYCPASGGARLLEADGTPIGVLPICLCDNQTLAFGPGDVLIVATDGFSEASSPTGELFGYERLLELADELRGEPAQVIAYGLLSTVESFSAGHQQDDDQTLVVLKGVAS